MNALLNRCTRLEAAVVERINRERDEMMAEVTRLPAHRHEQFMRQVLETFAARGWLPPFEINPFDMPEAEKHAYALSISDWLQHLRGQSEREAHVYSYEMWRGWKRSLAGERRNESE
jgi:hypothetical protein